jgi:hypothetical protein
MISVNLNKAKSIAHDIRRARRAQEFAPYDQIIALQIPGAQAAAAEVSRQVIRDKYAAMQLRIDAATTETELKAILDAI